MWNPCVYIKRFQRQSKVEQYVKPMYLHKKIPKELKVEQCVEPMCLHKKTPKAAKSGTLWSIPLARGYNMARKKQKKNDKRDGEVLPIASANLIEVPYSNYDR